MNSDYKIWHSFIGNDHLRQDLKPAPPIFMRSVLSGIIEEGGIDGMRTKSDIESLVAAMEADLTSGSEFGVQMLWVWGQKKHRE